MAAVAPISSWVAVDTRRSFLPMRDRHGREGHHHGRRERQDRVDPEHRGYQRDNGRDIPQEHGGEAGQRFFNECEIGGEALGQRGRAFVRELGEIGIDHRTVELHLHIRLDARDEAVGEAGLSEQRKALGGGDRDDEERSEQDGLTVLCLERLVGTLDQDRVEAGGGGNHGDAGEDDREHAPARRNPFPPQPQHGRHRGGGKGQALSAAHGRLFRIGVRGGPGASGSFSAAGRTYTSRAVVATRGRTGLSGGWSRMSFTPPPLPSGPAPGDTGRDAAITSRPPSRRSQPAPPGASR